jgi:hypothetical protein
MADPLSRALSESTAGEPPVAFDPRPIAETIDTLRGQIRAVLDEHFFDAGIADEAIPVLHATLIDSGSIRISARRADPAYEAVVVVDARSVSADKDEAQRFEIEAKGILRRLRAGHSSEHAFAIAIVPAADGTRAIDAAAFTAELTAAIRRFADEDHRTV